MIKKALILLILAISTPSFAGTRYVLAAAKGANTGADWGNAYPSLATALSAATRGDLIYIGAGTYTTSGATGFNFSIPDSGSTPIELRAATAADHGTGTGWSSSFATDVTPATLRTANNNTFASILTVTSDYWILNGNGRTDYENGYHLVVDNSWPNAVGAPINFSGAHDVTMKYVKLQGAGLDINNGETTSSVSFTCSGGNTVNAVVNSNGVSWHLPYVGKWITVSGVSGGSGFNVSGNGVQISAVTDLTHFSYPASCSGSGTGGKIQGPFSTGEEGIRIVSNSSYNIFVDHSLLANSSSDAFGFVSNNTAGNGFVLSYSEIWGVSSNAVLHSEGMGIQQANNVIIKYNVFRDTEGTSYLADVLCASGCPQTSDNWQIYGNVVYISSGNPTGRTGAGWGLVFCQQNCTNFKIYNNTAINLSLGAHYLWGWQTLGNGNQCSNIDVRNNIVYASGSNGGADAIQGGSCTSYTRDYNTWLNSSGPSTPNANEVVIASGAANPFSNWTASPGNFTLVSDVPNRVSLGTPYDTDAAGIALTTSRGVFQFLSSIVTAPAPPSGLAASAK